MVTSTTIQQTGIYEIRNRVNGHCYVGQSIDVERRWLRHRHALRLGKHYNRYLQRAWDKYGENAFELRILAHVNRSELTRLEQHFVDALDPEYNMLKKCAISWLGVAHSAESRAKISSAKKLQFADPIYRARFTEIMNSPKVKANLSAAQSIPAVRAHNSAAQRISQARSDVKAKKSVALRASWARHYKERVAARNTPEARARISAVAKISHNNPVAKLNMSLSHLGKIPWNKGLSTAPETRAKLCIAQQARWARTRSSQEASKLLGERGDIW